MMPIGRSIRAPIALAGAFVVWGVHFVVLYSFAALACARRFADAQVFGLGIVPAVGALTTLLAVLACLWLIGQWHGAGRGEDGTLAFLRRFNLRATGLALLAIAWNALPLVLVTPCGEP